MPEPSESPSLRQYYSRVWAKASQIEKRGWRKHVFLEILPTAIGVFILIALLGTEVLDHIRYELALIGLGLICFGVWRFVSSLVRAPHHMYVDDRAAFLSARDTLQAKYLSDMEQARNYTTKLANNLEERDRALADAATKQLTETDRRAIARALETARQALQYLVMCEIPGQKKVGTQLDLQSARHSFVQEVKRKTNDIITVCDRDTARMPGIALGTDGLDGIDESRRLSDYITSKIETIEALARTI